MRKSDLLFLLFAFITACSSDSKKPAGESEVENYYKRAIENVEDERYLTAIENLTKVKDEYPYSKFAVQAVLKLADVYFLQEEYETAFAQYTVFRDLYPTNEKIEYVIYRQAESLFKSLPSTIDRDLVNAPKAIKYYEEVREKFPNGEYSKVAGEGIQKSRNKLLEKEDYIGNFYYIRNYWSQAFHRYENLRKTFPNSRLDDKAMYRMVVCLQKQEKDSSPLKEEFKRLHPSSSYLEDLD